MRVPTPPIKPCPFCGRLADVMGIVQGGKDLRAVECWSCRATGPLRDDRFEAILAWNRYEKEGKRWQRQ
jgi:Lar family restriction alleviation protein